MRITDEVALDCAQGGRWPAALRVAAFSQGLPNTPMAGSTVRVVSGNFITARPVGVLDGVDFQHSGLVPGGRGRHHPHAGLRRDGAAVTVRLLPQGEAFNLTMEESPQRTSLQADKLIS